VLNPGQRLGTYEIVGALGQGGMGAVYRATDVRLKRDVAIKILPEAFTQDAEALRRRLLLVPQRDSERGSREWSSEPAAALTLGVRLEEEHDDAQQGRERRARRNPPPFLR